MVVTDKCKPRVSVLLSATQCDGILTFIPLNPAFKYGVYYVAGHINIIVHKESQPTFMNPFLFYAITLVQMPPSQVLMMLNILIFAHVSDS